MSCARRLVLIASMLVTASYIAVTAPAFAFDGADSASAVPRCQGHPATIVANRGGGYLFGTDGPDVIVGSPRADYISAGDGNDIVCGRGGGDGIEGERGNDLLYGGADGACRPCHGRGTFGDSLEGGPGRDELYGGPGLGHGRLRSGDDRAVYQDAKHGVTVSLAAGRASGEGVDHLHGIEGIFGSYHDDVMIGDKHRNDFSGITGSDIVKARGGNDFIFGGLGNDILDAGAGIDLVFAEEDSDVVRGGPGADLVYGDGFAESGSPSADDVLYGGKGDDFMRADTEDSDNAGNDQLVGGPVMIS
jgi:Ca2+-binding RTX toxin-like protein